MSAVENMKAVKKQAVDLLRANRMEDARALLRGLCDRHPRDAESWHLLGNVQRMLGNMEEAADCCRRVIALKPDHGQSYVNLGNVSRSRGRYDEAADYFRQALRMQPELDSAHFGLGNVFFSLGRYSEAEENYRRVLQISPNHAAAHNKLGAAASRRGAHGHAVEHYERAVRLRPDHPESNYNLGYALNETGRHAEAAGFLRRAVALRPDFAEAWNSLGVAVMSEKKFAEARQALAEALRIKPDFVEAVYNYAHVCHALGSLDAAIENYRRAIELKPDYAEAHMNLGTAVKDRGDPDLALESYRRAAQLRPDFAAAYNFMGITYREQGKLKEAMEMSEKALAADPGFVDAHFNLANVYAALGDMGAAAARFRRVLEFEPDHADAGSGLLMAMLYLREYSPEDVLREAKAWASRHAPASRQLPQSAQRPDPGRGLRIGYLSGDFCRHPVGFFIEPVIARHDPAYEVYCYCNNASGDDVTDRIRGSVRQWREVACMSDEELAQQIRKDGVDILVDLSGHTARNRLGALAYKPAPVQATWTGYPSTTGVEAVDYIIADRVLIPAREENCYVERAARLPHGHVCFAPPDGAPAVCAPPVQSSGSVTFGSLNNLGKVTPSVVACWSEVLQAVPSARLFLKYRWLSDVEARRRYRDLFAGRGIDPQRIAMSGYSDRQGMLAAYNGIDIALDPFPYNGGITTLEALWMGVPVITLRGDSFVSHASESVLAVLGMEEWVADAPEDYVAKAVLLAGDVARLAAIRRGLREQMSASAYCDAAAFVGALEGAYRKMWEAWCRGG